MAPLSPSIRISTAMSLRPDIDLQHQPRDKPYFPGECSLVCCTVWSSASFAKTIVQALQRQLCKPSAIVLAPLPWDHAVHALICLVCCMVWSSASSVQAIRDRSRSFALGPCRAYVDLPGSLLNTPSAESFTHDTPPIPPQPAHQIQQT